MPKAIASPRSVDWRSLPRLLQEIGADGLAVTGAANLLVGLIIGLLGVSQLGRFGAVAFVPELVVVAQFRELGPLVTAIVVAGRSGAGLASELATMKVSEEIDALRSMGFDPVRWLVVPRCIALVAVVPLLTWVGNVLALFGGFVATTRRDRDAAARVPPGDAGAITAGHFVGGARSRARSSRWRSASSPAARGWRRRAAPPRSARGRRAPWCWRFSASS